MGFYDQHILPVLIAAAMREARFAPYRRRIVGQAEGRVLEIGAGAGANLPFYTARATEVCGLEPHGKLRLMASAAGLRVIDGSAEAIPLERDAVDTVVMTWTLCSIANAGAALQEIRRVLRPGGRLLFVEHGLAPEESVQRWQHRLTPLWGRVAGGCHLDRDIPRLLREAGFQVERLEGGYMPGPRLLTYMYEGAAR